MDKIRHYRFGYFVIIVLIGFVVWSTVIHFNSKRQIENNKNTIRNGFEERGFDVTDEKWNIYINGKPDEKLKIYKEWCQEAGEIP